MSISNIISHTPVWVWVLFIFLLSRGLVALRTRETRPVLMLILPVVFFVWALYAILFELSDWQIPLAAFAVTLCVGLGLGWSLARRLPPAIYHTETKRITRPGSPLALILILIGFSSKYVMAVVIATHPEIGGSTRFLLLYGAISGLVDGLFWGSVILQLRQAFGSGEKRTSPSL